MKVSNITFFEKPSIESRANTYGQTDVTMLVGAFRGTRTRLKRKSVLALFFIQRVRDSESRSSMLSFLMGM